MSERLRLVYIKSVRLRLVYIKSVRLVLGLYKVGKTKSGSM